MQSLDHFLPDSEQRLLFCLLHFEANDFPVPGLRVCAVTSAVAFSHENIFGFDILADVRKWYCGQETLLNSKTKTNFPSFFTLKLTHQY